MNRNGNGSGECRKSQEIGGSEDVKRDNEEAEEGEEVEEETPKADDISQPKSKKMVRKFPDPPPPPYHAQQSYGNAWNRSRQAPWRSDRGRHSRPGTSWDRQDWSIRWWSSDQNRNVSTSSGSAKPLGSSAPSYAANNNAWDRYDT